MFAALVLLVLCQQPLDPTRSAEASKMMLNANRTMLASSEKLQTSRAKREFAERFNHLVSALKDFEEAYSSNRGEVWPAKQAAKLDMAMRELSDNLIR